MNDETRRLVAEIEEATAAAGQRAAARAAARIRIPLESALGSITVSGHGELLSVDLDPANLRYTNESRVASAVRTAIRQADGGRRG
ncbi:YbaB/EbfC family nucleoid-associated protein [Actinosynnema sp. NPDC023587]|uniref:YbaB/EbfC family nucleoid-associated protein n=1 Tax=Actinosynnema sp. NPDC023587 TaxID=3154695 RepID=UPI0033F21963